jgi:hypothetical protein
VQRLFLSTSRSAFSARHIVQTPTPGPPGPAQRVAQLRQRRVRSEFTSFRKSCRSAAPMVGAGPRPRAFAAIVPSLRCWRSSFCTNQRLTPNRSATSCRVSRPSSHAAPIRWRRSRE